MTMPKIQEKKKNEFSIGHYAIAPEQILFTPGRPYYHSTFFMTSVSSKIHSKSSKNVTPDKVHHMKNIATIIGSPFLKYHIYPREGVKPPFEESENFHSDNSRCD